MNASNWPGGVDRSSSNWSGRVPRTNDWGGAWAPDSHRIPKLAWLGAAVVAGLLFVAVPLIGYAAGF